MRLLLGLLVVTAAVAAVIILRTDVVRDGSTARRWIEAVIPLLALLALLWWVWVSEL